jgi:hypothetical protein
LGSSMPPPARLTHCPFHSPVTCRPQALGKVMGAELPKVPGGSRRVLYPASVKASTDLQVGGHLGG